MADKHPYSEDELSRYFSDPEARRQGEPSPAERPKSGVRGFFHRRIRNPKLAQAAAALSVLAGLVLAVVLVVGLYMLTLTDDLPPIQKLEDPSYQLATVAYTADGKVLARYARENRSWASFDEISPHAVNALVATEDRRFYDHWGIDMRGIAGAVQDAVTEFDLRGASTISQQLARNLYNEEIGFEITVPRKLKEMVTAVELERRYTKREIIEMYLNTVPFLYNAYGIEAAAETYFGKSAPELDALESATLIGMLKAPSFYNPIKNPENARQRRNVVLSQMVKRGFLKEGFYEAHKDDPVETDYHSVELDASLAPYFAEYVRTWMQNWSKENGYDFYEDGLRVYTTLDSKMQELASAAVQEQMDGLQAVVDYEWSRSGDYYLGKDPADYVKQTGYEPFDYFFKAKREEARAFLRETSRYEHLRETGVSEKEAYEQLFADDAFMDSLRTEKTRLEAGLVSMDPKSGYVKVWVGGRNFTDEKYDKVAIAKRQPGSTFKPFVYTAAVDNGYSPYYTVRDSVYSYRTGDGKIWAPENFDGSTGQMTTLSQGLAQSKNTITARVITTLVNPQTVSFYARRMGVRESELQEVPALGLGASEVTLLEMVAAYSTLANGGLYYAPTVVTRIEDRHGNVLFEAQPAPEEALPEATAYTIVDMMRGVVDYGTGQRIRWQFGLGNYDLAGKTGTTQESADGWFMLMHPDLVTGAWVGFNDRRVTFRSNFWGQGAHNALFVVGDYFKRLTESEEIGITNEQFPLPEAYGGMAGNLRRASTDGGAGSDDDDGRVGW